MTSQNVFQAGLTDGLIPKRSIAIYGHPRALIRNEAKTLLMVDQDASPGPTSPDTIDVIELGSNKLEATEHEFDTAHKQTIVDWLF